CGWRRSCATTACTTATRRRPTAGPNTASRVPRRRSPLKLWTSLGKRAAHSAVRLQQAAAKPLADALKRTARAQSKTGGEAAGTMARRVLTGVASPAPAPVSRGSGNWHEGTWAFGLAQRRYRLFVPAGVSARRPAPLLLLLHGCGQDAASFAASTRVAAA